MKRLPNTAIVLAGGFGTRLRSVVSDLPKPMAPVAGRPFVAYLLDHLEAAGIEHVVLATGYLSHRVSEALGERHGNIELSYSVEPKPLGTGGAVRLALEQLASRPDDKFPADVWILNGDTYFDCDLHELAAQHARNGAAASLALHRVEVADRYGTVELDEAGRITAFREKRAGSAGLINAGTYLVRTELLRGFDPHEAFSLEREVFEAGVEAYRLQGVVAKAYFVDIGIPKDYARAQERFARR